MAKAAGWRGLEMARNGECVGMKGLYSGGYYIHIYDSAAETVFKHTSGANPTFGSIIR